jgi:hypothetical protein
MRQGSVRRLIPELGTPRRWRVSFSPTRFCSDLLSPDLCPSSPAWNRINCRMNQWWPVLRFMLEAVAFLPCVWLRIVCQIQYIRVMFAGVCMFFAHVLHIAIIPLGSFYSVRIPSMVSALSLWAWFMGHAGQAINVGRSASAQAAQLTSKEPGRFTERIIAMS